MKQPTITTFTSKQGNKCYKITTEHIEYIIVKKEYATTDSYMLLPTFREVEVYREHNTLTFSWGNRGTTYGTWIEFTAQVTAPHKAKITKYVIEEGSDMAGPGYEPHKEYTF